MRKAFTLAEVLITLGIIGVVASLTLPALIQNHQKRSLEVATQKFYSMMSQAVRQYMADEGVDDLRNTDLTYMSENWNFDNAQKPIYQFVKRYFKIAKECDENEKCLANEYKLQNGSTMDFASYYGGKAFITTDGIIFYLWAGSKGWPMRILVDVNGKKGPNKVGYDLWDMDIFYDGSIDEGSVNPECRKGIPSPESGDLCGSEWGDTPTEVREAQFEWCKNSGYGGCFGHFLENNFKFDY